MRILLSSDAHGKIIKVKEKIDLVLIAGDFAKADNLRKMIFRGGSINKAKKEVISSSEKFFDALIKLKCPIVVSLGNTEEIAKNEIISLMKDRGIIYCNKKEVKIKGANIAGVDFFVEKWWVKKYKSNNEDTKKRANIDEKELKNFLNKIKKVDIFLSHLPPYGILDFNPNPPIFLKNYVGNMGSKILKKSLLKIKPKLFVCGHIHIPGEIKLEGTTIINPGESKIIDFIF